MIRLLIISYWIEEPGRRYPYFPADPSHQRADVTGQETFPANPNATIWEVVTANPDLYRNDPDLYILSEEDYEVTE